LDRLVQYAVTMAITAKGEATRSRIVQAAADLILARGVGSTSLDEIRAGTATSKSQLFHYFPGGKRELVGAIAAFQSGRVLDAQRPWLDALDSWEAWDAWRDAVVAHYGSQPHWGCPIGALVGELAGSDPELAAEVDVHMEDWRSRLEGGLTRMRDTGLLRSDADPEALALHVFAALQGGLLLTQSLRSIRPLEAALDGALAALRSWAGQGLQHGPARS
jgi:AcrR family transcriptional regulator